jgi:hypothetical protein
MDGPSNRVFLLLFCSFQALTFGFVQYMLNKQNQFYAQMLSTQNLQIQNLTANLSKLAMLNAEQGQLIIDLQFQQKVLMGATITIVLVLGGFFLFLYSPGVSPEVAQNHMSFITDSFISQNNVILEMLNDIEKMKATAKLSEQLLQDSSAATELLLNAAEGFEAASKVLS